MDEKENTSQGGSSSDLSLPDSMLDGEESGGKTPMKSGLKQPGFLSSPGTSAGPSYREKRLQARLERAEAARKRAEAEAESLRRELGAERARAGEELRR